MQFSHFLEGFAQYLANSKCDSLSLGLYLARSPEVCKLYVRYAIPLASLEVDEGTSILLACRYFALSSTLFHSVPRILA